MSLDLYSRFLLALLAVLALLAGFAFLVRRFGPAGRCLARSGRRLAVVEVAPIDGKRRLVLIRRDAVEHLVLIGTDSAIVVERGIVAPGDKQANNPGAFKALIEESAS